MAIIFIILNPFKLQFANIQASQLHFEKQPSALPCTFCPLFHVAQHRHQHPVAPSQRSLSNHLLTPQLLSLRCANQSAPPPVLPAADGGAQCTPRTEGTHSTHTHTHWHALSFWIILTFNFRRCSQDFARPVRQRDQLSHYQRYEGIPDWSRKRLPATGAAHGQQQRQNNHSTAVLQFI